MEEQNYIVKIISNPNPVQYKKDLEAFLLGKDIKQIKKGASLIPIPGPGGMPSLMCVPYAYIEINCTAEEYAVWKNQIIM